MKNVIIVISLICASLISLRAEPLNDPDFEQFFAQFQKDLAKNKIEAIKRIINTEHILQHNTDENCHSQIMMAVEFCSDVRSSIDMITKLSPKNSFTVEKKPYHNWEVYKIEEKYAKELFGLNVAYHLSYSSGYGECSSSLFCTFGKIRTESGKFEWRIINFNGVG